MERNWFICVQLGWLCAMNPKMDGDDLRYKLDEILINSKFIPLKTDDDILLDEVCSELFMGSVGRGNNRGDRRNN